MARFTVAAGERDGEEIVLLRDGETGGEAQLWPACGNNCFSLTLPRPAAAGRPDGLVTVIQAPPSLQEIQRRPSWWGIPLLFPFPGSMPGGEYEFDGRQYRLGRPDQPVLPEGKDWVTPGSRRDYHGFVMDLPWVVEETAGDDREAAVRCSLDSRGHPDMHEGFPFPYRVEAAYALSAEGLRLDFLVRNVGDGRLPFGFGAHPFFKLPVGPAGSPGECLLHVPAAARWRRGGERIDVPPELDLRTPQRFEPGKFNGMYTDLSLADGKVEAFIRDPANGLETVMRATANFPNVVVWSPPGRDEVCFEPWICPSNVFNLAARHVPNNGLVVLEQEEEWRCVMWVTLRAAR